MTELGMKSISVENWTDPDPTNLMFGWSPVPEDLLGALLEPRLSNRVPIEIARLFEVARGAMCYAWFFYPLWTLAAEQLFRVTDTAVGVRCQQLGAAASVSTFDKRIEFLKTRLPVAAEIIDWHGIRRLRNEASHPQQQTIISPGMAVPVVQTTARVLNQLFEAA